MHNSADLQQNKFMYLEKKEFETMLTNIASFLWILFIIVSLLPLFKQKNVMREQINNPQSPGIEQY